MRHDNVLVRPAREEDFKSLTALAEQLGYSNNPEDLRGRMKRYEDSTERIILAAEVQGCVAGWVSMEIVRLFYREPFVDISGFVVDAGYRNLGIGRRMLEEAEAWAQKTGCGVLQLNTNIIREGAHRFYERYGFSVKKQQRVYVKEL